MDTVTSKIAVVLAMVLGGCLLVTCSNSDAGNSEKCVAPVSGPCDPMKQCGCGSSQQCAIIYASGKSACIDAGNNPVGSTCNQEVGYGQCVPGATCVGSVCMKICMEDTDCPTSEQCVQIGYDDDDGNFIEIPKLKVCYEGYENCEPWDETSCGDGQMCYQASDFGEKPGTFVCASPGGTSTLTCSSTSDCAPGWVCAYDSQGGGLCRMWCRVGGSDCSDGQFCERLGGGGVYSGTTEVGICDTHCEPWDETSCSDGQKCNWASDFGEKPGTFVCASPGGTSTLTCSSQSDCAPGWNCFDDGQGGLCRRWCRVGGSDCSDGQFCGRLGGGGAYSGTTEVGICTTHCEPWDETSCGSWQQCIAVGNPGDKPGTFDCRPGGTSTTSCSKVGECAPGWTCMSFGYCRKYCRVGGSDCADGQFCGRFGNGGWYWGTTEVGYCTAHCQPWVETSCDSGMTCQWASAYGEKPGTFDCDSGGTSTTSCSQNADCAPGWAHCNAAGRCHRWCRIGGSDCPSGQFCLEVTSTTSEEQGAYWGTTEVGTCRYSCTSDSNCPTWEPACIPSGRCAQCSETNHTACPADKPVCDASLNVCVP